MHYYINWALCNLPTFILPACDIIVLSIRDSVANLDMNVGEHI